MAAATTNRTTCYLGISQRQSARSWYAVKFRQMSLIKFKVAQGKRNGGNVHCKETDCSNVLNSIIIVSLYFWTIKLLS